MYHSCKLPTPNLKSLGHLSSHLQISFFMNASSLKFLVQGPLKSSLLPPAHSTAIACGTREAVEIDENMSIFWLKLNQSTLKVKFQVIYCPQLIPYRS